MNIGICRFNASDICFAGARRPLYVVTDGELTKYSGGILSEGRHHATSRMSLFLLACQ